MLIFKKNGIKCMAEEYFQHLFTAEDFSFDKVSMPNLSPVISERNLKILCINMEDLEIKYALFSIEAWKAPEPYGFLVVFSQRYCNIFWSHI